MLRWTGDPGARALAGPCRGDRHDRGRGRVDQRSSTRRRDADGIATFDIVTGLLPARTPPSPRTATTPARSRVARVGRLTAPVARARRPRPADLPRHRAAPARPRLPLAVVRPGRQRDRQPDHPDRAAVPGLRPDRIDPGHRRADALPAHPDPAVRARGRFPGRCGRPAATPARDAGRSGRLQPRPGPARADRRAARGRAVRGRVRRRRAVGGRPAGPLVGDPAARPARAPAVGHRAQPAQLPARLDRRAGHRRHPHRDDRDRRGVHGRPPVVHGVVRGAAGHPSAAADRSRRPPRARGHPRRACASRDPAGRSWARSSSTSTR